jgi:type I restriction enzyme S subunit
VSFPAYPSYRESGVEWLGAVPSHWGVDRLKASIIDCRNGVWGEEADGGDDDILCVRVADFDRTSLRVSLANPTQRRVTAREREDRLVRPGDLLIEKSGGGEKQPVGAVVLFEHPVAAVCSNFVARMRLAGGMVPGYWLYVHAAAYTVRLTVGSINQTSGIQNLDQWRYFEERAPFPPASEQVAIAAFLDRETARIDALIQEQQRLIELLKEKRQAVISHAVTKGLDPTAPMKDSGVEWLGEVPAHWQLAPLKRDLAFLTSGSRGWADHYADDGALFIRIGNLTRDSIDLDLSDIQMVEVPTGSEGERTRVRPGDVLFSITAFLGSVAVIPDQMEEAYVSQHVALARPSNRYFLPDWIGYVTLSYLGKTQLEVGGYGGTKVQLSLGDIGDLLISAPPLAEQVTIVHALEGQLRRLSSLSCEAQIAVEILQERRSALISAAVTGKIDVRGVLKPKPEFESSSYADL